MSKKYQIRDVLKSLKTGVNPRSNFVLNTPDAKNWYVTVREIGGFDVEPSNNTDLINDHALEFINNRSNLEKDDILFSGTGTIGKITLIKSKPLNWNIKEGVYSLKPNIDIVDPYFLTYKLKYFNYLNVFNRISAGSTIFSVPMERLLDVPIDLPDLQDQQKIASVLSTIDTKIGLNNKINTELEAMAKTLYDYWFVQFDFPDENNKPYKSSGGEMRWSEELKREIPKGWEVKKIGDLMNKYTDKSLHIDSKDILPSGKYPVITQDNGDFISGFTNEKNPIEDIPMIIFGDHSCTLRYVDFPFFRGADGTQIMSFDKNLITYVYLFLQSIITQIPNYGKYERHYKYLKEFQLVLPDSEYLEKFQKILKPIMEKISQSRHENQKLAEIRDWLLPMLMNGQVVVDDESTEKIVLNKNGAIINYQNNSLESNDSYRKIQLLYTTIWSNKEIGVKQGEMATAKDIYLLDRIYGLKTDFHFSQHNWGSFDPEEKKLLNTKQYFQKTKFPNSEAFYLDLKDNGNLIQKIPSELIKQITTGIQEMNNKVFKNYFGTKKSEEKELYATVLKCIEDRKSIDCSIIREEMRKRTIEQKGIKITKADKFSEVDTCRALNTIIENKRHTKIVK